MKIIKNSLLFGRTPHIKVKTIQMELNRNYERFFFSSGWVEMLHLKRHFVCLMTNIEESICLILRCIKENDLNIIKHTS